MKKLFLLIIALVCFTAQASALDLSKTFKYGGLTVKYPSIGYTIADKGNNGQYYFNLNKNVTGDELALSTYRYGKHTLDPKANLHTLCNERLEMVKGNMKGYQYVEKFENNPAYVEDYGTYSMGVITYTAILMGHRIYGRDVVVISPNDICVLVVTTTDINYLYEFDQISKTITFDNIPDFRISNLYSNYQAYVQNLKEPQNNGNSTGTTPQASKPVLAQKSKVDMNIPRSKVVNDKTFAIIIANENYQEEASVPYALNDGSVFKNYCQATLGIPENNIHYRPNATLNNIRKEINWLDQVCQAYEGQANVLFYYAGHGIPDEATNASYLLPVDGSGSDITTGYKLDDLYAALGGMPASRVIVFMDACFSGSKRESGMLASARGVALNAKAGAPKGNMVVFSASQGDETAYPNKEEGHGMFTYFLLKKLQETGGEVKLSDLSSYITSNVRQQAIVINGKSQTPCTSAASGVGNDWQNWKLK